MFLSPLLALAGCVAFALLGCGGVSEQALHASVNAFESQQGHSNPTPIPSPNSKCGDPTASLRPRGPLPAPGKMPAGTFMRTIQDRGRLIVGVDQNSLLLSYLNPFDGQIEGFDIDMLHQVAKALLGSPNAIEFKAISTAQRVPMVESESVDIVADAMTINCARAKQVAFTTVYYDAGQRILVPSNSRVRGIRDLAGRRVCAVVSSTSIENIRRLAPKAIPHPVPLRTDCLVALQEGKVDAISTDDAILAGLKAQDPFTTVVGSPLAPQPYGLAISKQHPDFVRFVNAVLAAERADGGWAASYAHWVGTPVPNPPTAHYAS